MRVAAARYADGVGAIEDRPRARWISNRIFNDTGQDLFSENGSTQWGWVWGQFLDHDFGLEDQQPRPIGPIPFDPHDMVNRKLHATAPAGTWSAPPPWRRSRPAGSRSCPRTVWSRCRSRWASPSATRTCSRALVSAQCSPGWRRSASTATTSRSTTRCAASCSSSRSPGRSTRASATGPRSTRPASTESTTSGPSTCSARATTASPRTTRSASPTGSSRRTPSRRSRASRPGRPSTSAAGSTDPSILDFVGLRYAHENPVAPGSGDAVSGVRRTTLASRLRTIYGDVGRVDALVGMMSEPHVPGAEFGALQLAMWKRQFQRLRDGDRFYYLNDPALAEIRRRYGISYRHTLADLIGLDTGVPVRGDVFKLPPG